MLDNSRPGPHFGAIPSSSSTPRSASSSTEAPPVDLQRVNDAKASCAVWRWRLLEEWNILGQIWPRLLVDAVILLYLTPILFLNLAYYRFIVEERLPDLGFYYLPELSKDFKPLVDLPMIVLNVVFGAFLLVVMIQAFGDAQGTEAEEVKTVPYLVNIVDTFCSNFALGHMLRAVTYLSTTSPGVSRMCLSAVEVERHRPTLEQVFYRRASFTENCGDLMFSGHLLQMIVVLLILRKYGRKVWNASERAWNGALICGVLLVMLEGLLIVMARHHYTADVVVATYVTPLMWYSYHLYITDAKPDVAAVADRVLRAR